MSRFAKQLIIALVYVLIIGGIGFLFFRSSYGPTCYDGIQNGKEEGVDCGTIACGSACASPIQALQVQSVQLVRTLAGDHDLAFQLYNPNTDYGVSAGTFELAVENQRSIHDFYMLPGQTKYIVLTSILGLTGNPSVEVSIKSVQWEKVSIDPNVRFTISNEHYNAGESQTIFEAMVTNDSDYDFESVDIQVSAADLSGRLLATNVTNVRTFLSKTSRYVKLTWPFVLPADARVSVQAATYVFDNDNFLKRNGTQERFQQYY